MQRRPNFQTVAWFNDLRQRNVLDLEPPYQRRSVWNQSFKDYFIETVLLGLPAPAIFLYQDISPDGFTLQHVVDGKQRLTSIFEFIENKFPVAEDSKLQKHQGMYFRNLPDAVKKEFWSYILLVEYVPSDDEEVIKGIFDRINRNTVKLTAQELRHARFSGEFISTAESLSEWMELTLGKNLPRIVQASRKQMKDVEFVSYLMLLVEEGVKGYSQEDLDTAYANRDEAWEKRVEVDDEFRTVTQIIRDIARAGQDGFDLESSRLRNQADFYSLFGALMQLYREKAVPTPSEVSQRLMKFVERLSSEKELAANKELQDYFDAARSASNDKGPRDIRIAIVKKVIQGLL
ncbi:hypothetical protein HNQ60_004531 [Povalibacter uvarum]|uniref:GmrSD restriction endonucleases N-terminal domain-containing protein n=1 Tax=Povalibacter uvarum TaxID=732238 RepID=A0A841HTV8_9GAMM|nr:DUF262 domain-containing protein [Povalibacter uvarum]MBB6095640.1 hypothetical protein [Povalibacter uvarum]